MTSNRLIQDICDFAAETKRTGAYYPTPAPGLAVLCDAEPTEFEALIYDPVVCLVLQGRKETRVGGRTVRVGAGASLIVSHPLPVVGAITQASQQVPYVAIVLAVDLGIVRSLYDEMGSADPTDRDAQSFVASATAPELIDAFARLFRAARTATDARVLAPLIIREIHFRLLQAEHGAMLRQMLWRDSAASRIGKVMASIRADLAAPMPVPDMAKLAGMSVSAFHEHFKAMTGRSPLQYRKELRLTEARRRLLESDGPISSVAFEVGYESPTQFSREYTRKFGVSPRQDLAENRAA